MYILVQIQSRRLSNENDGEKCVYILCCIRKVWNSEAFKEILMRYESSKNIKFAKEKIVKKVKVFFSHSSQKYRWFDLSWLLLSFRTHFSKALYPVAFLCLWVNTAEVIAGVWMEERASSVHKSTTMLF